MRLSNAWLFNLGMNDDDDNEAMMILQYVNQADPSLSPISLDSCVF